MMLGNYERLSRLVAKCATDDRVPLEFRDEIKQELKEMQHESNNQLCEQTHQPQAS